MKCEVQYVYKNMRYKLLTINGEHYIIDVDRPFWFIFFPFVYWMFPHRVFKVDDDNTFEQMKKPKVKQTKTSYLSLFAAGVSFLLAKLLTPLMHYFDIETSTKVNTVILFLFLVLVVLFRLYFSNTNQKNLYKMVNLKKLQIDKIWIRPTSFKLFCVCLLSYLCFGAFAVMGIWMFFDLGNIMVLLLSIFMTFILLLTNSLTVPPGNTKVRFRKQNTLSVHHEIK